MRPEVARPSPCRRPLGHRGRHRVCLGPKVLSAVAAKPLEASAQTSHNATSATLQGPSHQAGRDSGWGEGCIDATAGGEVGTSSSLAGPALLREGWSSLAPGAWNVGRAPAVPGEESPGTPEVCKCAVPKSWERVLSSGDGQRCSVLHTGAYMTARTPWEKPGTPQTHTPP